MNRQSWLPDWFDLRNYQRTGSMGLRAWANALEIRKALYFDETTLGPDEIAKFVSLLSLNPSWNFQHFFSFVSVLEENPLDNELDLDYSSLIEKKIEAKGKRERIKDRSGEPSPFTASGADFAEKDQAQTQFERHDRRLYCHRTK